MGKLGAQDSAEERDEPVRVKSYLRFEVDSARQVVRAEAKKVRAVRAVGRGSLQEGSKSG